MDESNQLNHDDESTTDHSGVSDSSKRKNTLKDRIKRAMASNEQASQSQSQCHANSVLTAASALASLGVDTPPSSDHGSIEKSGDEKHAALMTVVSVPSAGKSNVVTRSLPSRLENDVPMTFPQKVSDRFASSSQTDMLQYWLDDLNLSCPIIVFWPFLFSSWKFSPTKRSPTSLLGYRMARALLYYRRENLLQILCLFILSIRNSQASRES